MKHVKNLLSHIHTVYKYMYLHNNYLFKRNECSVSVIITFADKNGSFSSKCTLFIITALNSFSLAHLSQRLIGELIVYPWIRRPSSVRRRRSQCSNIFFSETAWPIKAKFYMEPPWVRGTNFCSRHLGHMTKMAATPIYGKNPSKIFFSRTGRRISTKLGM